MTSVLLALNLGGKHSTHNLFKSPIGLATVFTPQWPFPVKEFTTLR
jgi:hypothetical protein